MQSHDDNATVGSCSWTILTAPIRTPQPASQNRFSNTGDDELEKVSGEQERAFDGLHTSIATMYKHKSS